MQTDSGRLATNERSAGSSDPLIGIHDFFDQQTQPFELSEVDVFDRLIKAAINPRTLTLFLDREILLEGFAADPVGDSVLMLKVG